MSVFWRSWLFVLFLTAVLMAWVWVAEKFIFSPLRRALDRWYERRANEIRRGE